LFAIKLTKPTVRAHIALIVFTSYDKLSRTVF
jgi:hypothetical protein